MHFVYIYIYIYTRFYLTIKIVILPQLQKIWSNIVGSPCCFSLPRCLLDMNPSFVNDMYLGIPRIWWTPHLKVFMNLLWMRHFWTWILSGAWVAWVAWVAFVAFVANGSKPLGLRIIKHPVPTSRLVSCGGGSLHFQTQPETTETIWIISSFCLSKFMSQNLRP